MDEKTKCEHETDKRIINAATPQEVNVTDLFMKFAFCARCRNYEEHCKCSIMEPIMYSLQFDKALLAQKADLKAEVLEIFNNEISILKEILLCSDIQTNIIKRQAIEGFVLVLEKDKKQVEAM